MSSPDPRHAQPAAPAAHSKLLRTAMWVAIGAIIAAAIICVVWVLIGSQNGIVGRAFLTILLLAAFAGAAMLDAHLAPRRPPWFALASMGTWVLILLIGAFLIWMSESSSTSYFDRLASFLLIVLILQLALLHVRLFTKAIERRRSPFTTIVGYITIGLVVLLAIMLVVPLTISEWVRFHDLYWRIVVAISILAAVGTALVPLVSALLAPRSLRPAPPQAWPTYVDGLTPLPVLPDGSPDWNAYYTGFPSPGATAVGGPTASATPIFAPIEPAPQPPQQQWATQPGYAPQQPPAQQQPWPAQQPTPWPQPQAPQQQQPAPQQHPAPAPQQHPAPERHEPPAHAPQPPAGGYPPPPPLPPQQ